MFSKAGVLLNRAINGAEGGVLSTDLDRTDREAGDDCECALAQAGVLTADCDLTVAGVLGPDRALMEVGVLGPDCALTDGDSVPTADCNPAGDGSKSKSVSLTLSPSALLAATSRAICTLL